VKKSAKGRAGFSVQKEEKRGGKNLIIEWETGGKGDIGKCAEVQEKGGEVV